MGFSKNVFKAFAGTVLASLLFGIFPAIPVHAEEVTKIIYHHSDHLTGSHIETDENGDVIQSLDYYPFGETRTDTQSDVYDNNYKFTGQELDDESGLYYYGARYYDPAIGKFISQDPWEGNINEPQTLNKYSYVINNPLKYIDPTGEYLGLDDAIAAGTGALIGLGGQLISDIIAWELSDWEDYAGAVGGGAVSGEATLYSGLLGPAIGAAADNSIKQSLKIWTGKQEEFDANNLAKETIFEATIGYFLPDIKIKGINKGKGNFNSISKQITTKLDRGTIKSIKKSTGYKMIIGHSIDWFPSEIIQSALKGAERSLNKDDNGYVSPNVHIR